MLYQLGFVTHVHNVIVYGVFPVLTLRIYSIPGLISPTNTVKSVEAIIFVLRLSIVIDAPHIVARSKSAYFISPTISFH